MKNKIRRFIVRAKRYIVFLFQYLVLEKTRGLDFTMRDLTLYKESNGVYHGYSKTNEKHLRDIFRRIDYDECTKLLDIGCGKGVVLKEAVRFPFKKIAGIELEKELVSIAEKNFKILGIADKVQCIHADAVNFTEYGSYNIFFLCNPFSEKILQKVADRIFDSKKKGDVITVIYHNPRFLNIFEDGWQVIDKEMLHDAMKDYDTCILRLKV